MDELFGAVPETSDNKSVSHDGDKADVSRVEVTSQKGERNA